MPRGRNKASKITFIMPQSEADALRPSKFIGRPKIIILPALHTSFTASNIMQWTAYPSSLASLLLGSKRRDIF